MGEKEMSLEQCEEVLADINNQISKLLMEREEVLKQWNVAFDKQADSDTSCEYEKSGDTFYLYLVNGDSRLDVCWVNVKELKSDINELYRLVDNSIRIHNMKNRRQELTERQMNLVLGKIVEIKNATVA